MSPFVLRLVDVIALLTAVWFVKRFITTKRNGLIPPGPTPLPFIGNLLDMPRSDNYPWKTFWKWGQRWGDIMSISVLGTRFIVVNSAEAAIELLEKRGAIYCDRQGLRSAKIIGYSELTPLLMYGEDFKEHRKMLAHTIGARAHIDRLAPLQEQEVNKFLLRLLREPGDLVAQIKRLIGSISLIVSHGYQVHGDGEDLFLHLSDQAVNQFAGAMLPAAFMVDIIPALQYWPPWLPGAGWRKRCAYYRQCMLQLGLETLNWTKSRMMDGSAIPSFVSRNLELSEQVTPEHEARVMWTATGLLAGGSHTTSSTIRVFFLAMTLYPEVQAKAQAEIDAIVGPGRLPTFADRQHLPYVAALISEVFRWMPVTPLGLPHASTEDDHYNGYFLPKGSVVIANLWGILHDSTVYKDPDVFNPERFLHAPGRVLEPEVRNIVFGFGRRICPGAYIAEASVYITIVNVLATLTISKATENGKVITPKAEQTSFNLSYPLPFKCNIKPRINDAEALIRAANECNDIV